MFLGRQACLRCYRRRYLQRWLRNNSRLERCPKSTRLKSSQTRPIWSSLRAHCLPTSAMRCRCGLRRRVSEKSGRRMANNICAVLSIIVEFAREKEWLPNYSVRGIRRLRRDRGPSSTVRGQSQNADRPKRRASLSQGCDRLGRVCGISEGDRSARQKDAIRDGAIHVVTEKRDVAVTMPIHRELASILENAPEHAAVTIAANSRGHSWRESGFNSTFSKFIDRLEAEKKIAPGLTMHGLRHTVGTRLREAGAELDDVRRLLGQKTLSMAQHYSESADRSEEAREMIDKLDVLGDRNTQILENRPQNLEN